MSWIPVTMSAVLALMGGVGVGEDVAVDVEGVRALVLPSAPEPWETIGWRTDLAAARREAAGEGKLLFLWSMNGHPCGST